MAYSRWSNSKWYTYWDSSHSGKTKDTQVFTICGDGIHFTYKQIKDDIDLVLSLLPSDASDLEIKEIELYLIRFMQDVENHEKAVGNFE